MESEVYSKNITNVLYTFALIQNNCTLFVQQAEISEQFIEQFIILSSKIESEFFDK